MNLPICDICKKPVNKVEWLDSFDSIEIMKRIYRVYCCGEIKETILFIETPTKL